MYWVFNTQKKT